MQLVSARCPDCGAELKIPEGSLNVTCEYCGSNILVSEILGSNSVIQNCMTLAYAALQNNNYKEAYSHFDSALEQDMRNYSAWFGKALCAGELSTVANPRFSEMMNMFDTALQNAPADKQTNIKKNAAAEAVKAVRNTAERRRLASQMVELGSGSFSGGELVANIQKTKDEVIRALNKAQEYDPSNNDIPPLINEVNALAQRFIPMPGINQQIQENFADAERKLAEIQEPAAAPPGPVYGKKKGGCGAVIAALVLIIIISIVVYFVVGNNDDNGTKSPPPKIYSSYTYNVSKITESEGNLYISLYTDAVDDSNLVKINKEMIKKYSDRKKPVIINYYYSKTQADRNGAVQLLHDNDWVLKNASSIDLKETSEYDPSDESVSFYRYIGGKTKKIEVDNDKDMKPKPPK